MRTKREFSRLYLSGYGVRSKPLIRAYRACASSTSGSPANVFFDASGEHMVLAGRISRSRDTLERLRMFNTSMRQPASCGPKVPELLKFGIHLLDWRSTKRVTVARNSIESNLVAIVIFWLVRRKNETSCVFGFRLCCFVPSSRKYAGRGTLHKDKSYVN